MRLAPWCHPGPSAEAGRAWSLLAAAARLSGRLLAAAPALFAGRRTPSREQELEAKIAALEAKLARKDAIIAEVSEEYVKLKNALGEP